MSYGSLLVLLQHLKLISYSVNIGMLMILPSPPPPTLPTPILFIPTSSKESSKSIYCHKAMIALTVVFDTQEIALF